MIYFLLSLAYNNKIDFYPNISKIKFELFFEKSVKSFQNGRRINLKVSLFCLTILRVSNIICCRKLASWISTLVLVNKKKCRTNKVEISFDHVISLAACRPCFYF